MKKILQLSFITLLLIAFITPDATAQRRGDSKKEVDDYFDESGGFKHRLWYGGGFNLGFAGNSVFSRFDLGISPMVGYKIVEKWSVGPRIALNYSYIKGTATNGSVQKVQPITYSLGVFTRYKLLNAILLMQSMNTKMQNIHYRVVDFWIMILIG